MTIARPMVRGIARPMARPLVEGVGAIDPYPGALWAIDWLNEFFAQGGEVQPDHTTVAGFTDEGAQDINADGLLCDGSGYGWLSDPDWPAGDWTFIIQADSLGTADDRPLFSLRAAGAYDPEFFTYTYNSTANVNAKELVSAATAFEDFVVDGAPAPVRVVITKNGTAVRSSANGQGARALGTWTAFSPTRLHLGVRGDTDQFRFGGRIGAVVLYGSGMTDGEIEGLSAGPFS